MEQEKDKRDRIIDAAIEVFSDVGFNGASMADVATKACVAKGTLYLYFDSKQALFEAAYQQCHQERMYWCGQNVEKEVGALEKLCLRLRNGTRWELKSPMKNGFERIYLSDPRFGESVHSRKLGMRADGVTKIIEDGMARGELRAMPSQLAEEMYYHLGSAVYYYIADHPQEAEDETLWDNIRSCLYGCLGKQQS